MLTAGLWEEVWGKGVGRKNVKGEKASVVRKVVAGGGRIEGFGGGQRSTGSSSLLIKGEILSAEVMGAEEQEREEEGCREQSEEARETQGKEIEGKRERRLRGGGGARGTI